MDIEEKLQNWFVPLSCRDRTLRSAYSDLQAFGLKQDEVPLMIQWVENPRFDLPGIDLFHGATDIVKHDYIHILLGRGIQPKDEAFVLGFTMGSTNRVTTAEERLYTFFTKYLYPRGYRFTEEETHVYKDAVKLGFISDCQPLSEVDFTSDLDCKLDDIRRDLGVEEDLLRAYYAIEKRRYPEAPESQRLFD